ncbi:MAG TPA: TolC family protein [Phycisphaerales bacterium]|nr:TolC family protein [Phycisphaerales bacterium]
MTTTTNRAVRVRRDRARAAGPRRGALALAVLGGLAGSGCSAPLGPAESDRLERRLGRERLHTISPLDVGLYARPAAEQPLVGGPEPATLPADALPPGPGAGAREPGAPVVPPPDAGAPAPGAPAPLEGIPRRELSIEEARAAALRHNLDLKVALVDPALAGESLRAERAKFESVFVPRVRFREADEPTFSTTASNQEDALSGSAGVEVPLRTGGRATVDLEQGLTQTSNPFFTLNTAYSSALNFSVSHPLLRGAGVEANEYSIRIAQLEEHQAAARTRLEVIRQLAAVDRAYWRLTAARQELLVRQQQHELAQAQLDRAERRVRAGAAAEIEVLRARSGLAERLEAIIIAQNQVLAAERDLKRIVNLPGLDLASRAELVTTTPPAPMAYRFEDPARLAELAVGARMEMLELELRLAADALTIGFEENQALPLLSLDYTYRIAGLGQTFRSSNENLAENDFESWSLGLSGEVPMGNEAARARVRRAVLARLQRLASRESRRLSISQEVLDAVDRVEAGWQRILAARQAAVAAARTFQAEQRQNDLGLRTSTDVLDAAARLAEAQTSEVRALADYQIALVDLAFATGTLLGRERVEWVSGPPAGLPER